ncbi:alcohol oxidase [Tricholoma matsutake]|nr:alcohol oxidase [Tricholoma matsutake 945]
MSKSRLNGPGFAKMLSNVGRHVNDKPSESKTDVFDIIIIGGGTAGCVLASRLTEDPSLRVLVLESGGSGRSLFLSRLPVGFPRLFHTKHVYELHTEPQISANGKKKYWPRGKMLGGCSSINAQMAQYGAPGDFDLWATIIDDDSWSWNKFSRYFTKFEKYVPDPDYPLVDSASKGSQGPVRVGYFSNATPHAKAFITACTTLGVPFSPDFNSVEGTRGVNRVLNYMDERRTRVSAESAYLTKDVLKRPNLVVTLHAQVTKILFDSDGDQVRAVGVEFAKSKNGPRYRASATKEVILSAGAVHSPQILMLSGIGPAQDLHKHQIPLIHDLPGVGTHLIDHIVVDLFFKNKLNNSPKHIMPKTAIDMAKFVGSTIQYFTARRGAFTTNFGESVAFVRSDDPALFPLSEFPVTLRDSTSASNSPDLEIFTTPIAYKNHGRYVFPLHTFAMHSTLLRPLSEGHLQLKSADPWGNPIMDPKYLEASEDIQKLMRGIKLILKIARTEPLASYLDHEYKNPELDHNTHLKSDEQLEQLIKDRVETLYHPASTCRMASLLDGGVVDSNLRVYGVQQLRVCDASIFPSIVSGHTTGAVLAVAEKLADVIKANYSESFKKD